MIIFLFICLYVACNMRYMPAMSSKLAKSNSAAAKLLDERARLLVEASTLTQILHGSWVERFMVCSRPDCKCHRGARHGPRYCLVVNEKGRQRQKYVASRHKQAVQEGLDQYRRLMAIADRITQLNLALMKENAYESR